MIAKGDSLNGRLFHHVAHQIRHRTDDELRPFDLTRATWLAISIVQDNDRLSQAELADFLGLGAAATGKVIDQLQERGLLVRYADPLDRRTNRLSATPEARKLIRKLRPIGTRIENDVLQDLSKKDRDKRKSYLVAIKETLSQLDETGSTQGP